MTCRVDERNILICKQTDYKSMFIKQKRQVSKVVVKRKGLSNVRLQEGHGKGGLLDYQGKEHIMKKSIIYVERVK